MDADIDFLAEHYGENDSLYFDIIGFDPRGVNNTTPQFSCFPSLLSKVNFGLQAEADGILGSSADSLMRNWQRAAALSQSCSEVLLARDDNDATKEARPRIPPRSQLGARQDRILLRRYWLSRCSRQWKRVPCYNGHS